MITYEQLGYPHMANWPSIAGPPPTVDDIITIRGLGKFTAGTKRELALAAYNRECASQYNTKLVAAALAEVMPGSKYNPMHNVANIEFETALQYGKVLKTKVGGGTAYKLQMFEKTLKLVAAYREKFMASVATMIPAQPVTESQADATATVLDVSPADVPASPACEAPAPLALTDTPATDTPATAPKGTKGSFKSKKATTLAKTETLTSEAVTNATQSVAGVTPKGLAAVTVPTTVTGSNEVAEALIAGYENYANGVLPESDMLLLTYQPETEVYGPHLPV